MVGLVCLQILVLWHYVDHLHVTFSVAHLWLHGRAHGLLNQQQRLCHLLKGSSVSIVGGSSLDLLFMVNNLQDNNQIIILTNIPNGKLQVFVLNCLNVESNSRDCSHNISKLEFVQDGSFA